MSTPHRTLVELTVVCIGSRWRIIVGGELDLGSGPDLVEVAGVLAAAGVPVVEIDLAAVSFIDTSGWRAVGDARALLAAHGASSVVTSLSPAVTQLVEALASTTAR
jgi:anti-anti-sigma factor